jgi:hypothetical protein
VLSLPAFPREKQCEASDMKLTIQLDREVDCRWIAEVPELHIILYGGSKKDALDRAEAAAREIVQDRIAHGESPPESANAFLEPAA